MISLLVAIPILLCWGSFLNVLSYRIVHDDLPITGSRSFCPKCNHQIAWHDLIPIISWIFLRGKCRHCNKNISLLYPLIELVTVLVGLGVLYLAPSQYLLAYTIFGSALIITIRTDLETMLISRFVTILLIPIALFLSLTYYSHNSLFPLNILDVVRGSIFGYLVLFITNKIFFFASGKNGMGQGDLDFLSFIGAFTGIAGVWISLMIGSILGSIAGVTLIIFKNNKFNTKIPFGPFLAIGALSYILFQDQLLRIFFC